MHLASHYQYDYACAEGLCKYLSFLLQHLWLLWSLVPWWFIVVLGIVNQNRFCGHQFMWKLLRCYVIVRGLQKKVECKVLWNIFVRLYKLALIYELMNVPYPPFSLIHNQCISPWNCWKHIEKSVVLPSQSTPRAPGKNTELFLPNWLSTMWLSDVTVHAILHSRYFVLHIKNCMYGSLQHKACISEALRPEVIAIRKTVFEVRYLRWQVPMGSNGGSLRAARTNSRHQVDNIIRGMPLVCLRPLIHLWMEVYWLRGCPGPWHADMK